MSRDLRAIVVAYVAAAGVAVLTALAVDLEHPLAVAFAADLAATLAIFAFSVAFDNSSFYDAYWSVAPLPIGIYWALTPEAAGGNGVRQLLALALVAAWGARLTFNWARGWSGLDHEDWRYVDLRRQTGSLYWIVSLLGLHAIPTLFVFAGCLALWPAMTSPAPVGWLDALAVLLAGGAIALEAAADRQLHAFRNTPHEPGAVLTSGLWARSRHPNYLGEIGFWWGIFGFGIAAGGVAAWWTGIGALAITALFVFVSLPLIETRMLERRPRYADVQKHIPILVPRVGTGRD